MMEQKIIDYLESENRFARENFEQYKADVKQFKKDKKLNLEMCMHTPVYTSEKQVSEKIEWNNTIITALKKQIPKKPTEEQIDFEEFVCICPTCKYTCEYGFEDFRDRKYEYCPMCGQKLDWGENNERN